MNKYTSKRQFHLENEIATELLASQIAELARPNDIITLAGDLGVGKTAFAKGFIRAMGGEYEVLSPTFTLVQLYDVPNHSIYHFDFYRVEDSEEILELGIEDAFSEGISLIEWPDRMDTYIPAVRLDIILSNCLNENSREVSLVAFGDSWVNRLAKVNI
jgi:tRNA threonylcarbamoyl adenosine modification protein YjeE